MYVVATAGHVDHGKSTLVRALTGIEPDRWEQERRRGLTIDLGYAWTTLPSGEDIAFVDVPGHERFIGNMLAGLGPAPAVVFVVAADEGWMPQSSEHLAAVDALGLRHGLVVVTRADLADPRGTLSEAMARTARSSMAGAESVAVSARTGAGLEELRSALDRLVTALPRADTEHRMRLWVDRSFSVRGSGTVVTGTLGQGAVRVGDEVVVHRAGGRSHAAVVRGLQSLEQPKDSVLATARVAVNLRGISVDEVRRGDLLLTPDAWHLTTTLDLRLTPADDRLPAHVMVHAGTVAVEARLRALGTEAARLTLPSPLPIAAGDRLILRDPGTRRIAGALVVDADPPRLTRRGAASRRAVDVSAMSGIADLAAEVERRDAMTVAEAEALGILVPGGDRPAETVARQGRWLVADSAWSRWTTDLRAAVEARASGEPLDPTMTLEAARAAVGVPDRAMLPELAGAAGLELRNGSVGLKGQGAALGERAELGLRGIERRLADHPFASPEQKELDAAGLGPREIAAAVRAGRLVRLPEDVLLQPSAPAHAMRVLASLRQPFTTSEARVALDSTRRTVIPLLEHLDARGWTRRLDGSHREVCR
ncbi:selenocysteine-specific translation elongation factor [Intrasporangium mesophilum]